MNTTILNKNFKFPYEYEYYHAETIAKMGVYTDSLLFEPEFILLSHQSNLFFKTGS